MVLKLDKFMYLAKERYYGSETNLVCLRGELSFKDSIANILVTAELPDFDENHGICLFKIHRHQTVPDMVFVCLGSESLLFESLISYIPISYRVVLLRSAG